MTTNDNTFSVTSPEQSSGFLLWQVTALWQQRIKLMLDREYGLLHSQYVVLANIHWLNLHNNEVTQKTLSDHSKIEPMTISQILKSLQKKGYIVRKEHSTDTRAKAVDLTTEGKELTKRAVMSVDEIDNSFFETLGRDINAFNGYLIKLIKAG